MNELKTDNAEYTEIMDTPGLKSWMKRESIFDKTKPVIKTMHCLGKDVDPFVVVEALSSRRMEWDKNLAEYKEVMKVSNDVSVIHCGLKSPNMFFQARDFAEKRVQLVDQGVYYAYYSSVPEEVLPVSSEYVRGDTIFSVSIIGIENGECVFYCISQSDIKAPSLPEAMIKPFIKSGIKAFYDSLMAALASYKAKDMPKN